MSLELIIFLIVAAVAIFSAAFMLVSRNAVHSALFLVTTMLCLAFCYLILNAPFLAMVQITVYAGAIMVLFMFVIMLLGADKLGELPTKYKWLPIMGVGLAGLFLFTAYFAIAQGNVGELKPVPKAPQIRVVNVAQSAGPVDVYLNNDKVASAVRFTGATDFHEVKAGDYNLSIFSSKADGSAVDPAKDAPVFAQAVSLKADTVTTFVAAPDKLISVPQSLSELDAEHSRYMAVNALPGDATANLIKLDPSNPNPVPEDRDKYIQVLAPALKYGDVSKVYEIPVGKYEVAWEVNTDRVNIAEPLNAQANEHTLVVLYPETAPGASTPQILSLDVEARTAAPFGGPNSIGEALFTSYLLPFELVSLLLLVAMVGAIIMTREEVIKRERQRVVVSRGANTRRLNQAGTSGLTVNPNEKNAESSAD